MADPGHIRWDRYCRFLSIDSGTGLSVDVSLTGMPEAFVETMTAATSSALAAMASLEAGSLANADEGRAVGHYWLRAPDLAPSAELGQEIRSSWQALSGFAAQARQDFDEFVHIGIGGSAAGPLMLYEAWGDFTTGCRGRFLDNADPDGVLAVLDRPAARLARTLVSVVSKSGITPTPREVVRAAERAYDAAGLDFTRHAVATTTCGSALAKLAAGEGWLATFPMWDWVGGRTSVTSMAGLVPAALMGADVAAFLAGAAAMDTATRAGSAWENPAAMLALAWFWLGGGCGDRAMVLLPYRDRLTVLVRWVQQLAMESLGKRLDRAGREVRQGLTVYGNKGVSDQHAYIQQLRDGRDDFFATLVGVHTDRSPGREGTLSDHLFGGLLGTLTAFADRDRPVAAITLPDRRERSLGALVALFERAVGLYAELIDVNAYHQPGVDKHTALPVLALQDDLIRALTGQGAPMTVTELADAAGCADRPDVVHRLLEHLVLAHPELVAVTGGREPGCASYFVPEERAHA